jgi:hypothetical protein
VFGFVVLSLFAIDPLPIGIAMSLLVAFALVVSQDRSADVRATASVTVVAASVVTYGSNAQGSTLKDVAESLALSRIVQTFLGVVLVLAVASFVMPLGARHVMMGKFGAALAVLRSSSVETFDLLFAVLRAGAEAGRAVPAHGGDHVARPPPVVAELADDAGVAQAVHVRVETAPHDAEVAQLPAHVQTALHMLRRPLGNPTQPLGAVEAFLASVPSLLQDWAAEPGVSAGLPGAADRIFVIVGDALQQVLRGVRIAHQSALALQLHASQDMELLTQIADRAAAAPFESGDAARASGTASVSVALSLPAMLRVMQPSGPAPTRRNAPLETIAHARVGFVAFEPAFESLRKVLMLALTTLEEAGEAVTDCTHLAGASCRPRARAPPPPAGTSAAAAAHGALRNSNALAVDMNAAALHVASRWREFHTRYGLWLHARIEAGARELARRRAAFWEARQLPAGELGPATRRQLVREMHRPLMVSNAFAVYFNAIVFGVRDVCEGVVRLCEEVAKLALLFQVHGHGSAPGAHGELARLRPAVGGNVAQALDLLNAVMESLHDPAHAHAQ